MNAWQTHARTQAPVGILLEATNVTVQLDSWAKTVKWVTVLISVAVKMAVL